MGRRNAATYEDVCKHANELTESKGLGMLLFILIENYHATRISEIPEDQYDEFIRLCIWLKTDLHNPLAEDYQRPLPLPLEDTYNSGSMNQ